MTPKRPRRGFFRGERVYDWEVAAQGLVRNVRPWHLAISLVVPGMSASGDEAVVPQTSAEVRV